MTLKSDLDKLASCIAKSAALAATPLAEQVDALKALTSLYAVMNKGGKRTPPADDGTPTFEDFADSIEEKGNGGPEARVRSRSRN